MTLNHSSQSIYQILALSFYHYRTIPCNKVQIITVGNDIRILTFVCISVAIYLSVFSLLSLLLLICGVGERNYASDIMYLPYKHVCDKHIYKGQYDILGEVMMVKCNMFGCGHQGVIQWVSFVSLHMSLYSRSTYKE